MTHRFYGRSRLTLLSAACLAFLAGCSGPSPLANSSKVDYRSEAVKTPELEIPPDLSQLARDSRFRPQSGVISASTVNDSRAQGTAATVTATPAVAINAIEDTRIERQGNNRWLVTSRTPEQLWPVLQSFWPENGLSLAVDNAAAGVMETNWAENRAKLPQDIVRRALGRFADRAYDTGTRDQFRTQLGSAPAGTEIYILHRAAVEEYVGTSRENTQWRAAPSDPQLEAEFLARLLVKLGNRNLEASRTAVAAAPAAPTAPRPTASTPVAAAPSTATSLDISEPFERAYRRVGLALDRAGFTVEDRDRSAGLYFVRYVPGVPGAEEPGLFARLFSSKDGQPPVRYRVSIKGAGETRSQVTVQNSQGQAETGEAARRIISLIANDLR
jgi:outer membrane protein assembly factor BamC